MILDGCPADTFPQIVEVAAIQGELPMLEGGKIVITTARGVYSARIVCMKRKKIVEKLPGKRGH